MNFSLQLFYYAMICFKIVSAYRYMIWNHIMTCFIRIANHFLYIFEFKPLKGWGSHCNFFMRTRLQRRILFHVKPNFCQQKVTFKNYFCREIYHLSISPFYPLILQLSQFCNLKEISADFNFIETALYTVKKY